MRTSKESIVSLVAGLAVLAVAIPASAEAGHQFSNAYLKGTYSCVGGFNSEWVPGSGGSSPTKFEFADLANFTSDGQGNYKGLEIDVGQCAFQDCGGFVCQGPLSATYKINPDGSGSGTTKISYTDQVNCGTFTGADIIQLGASGNTVNFLAGLPGSSTIGGVTTPVDSNVFTLYCTRTSK